MLGHVNDVLLYRELIRSGVSEYLVLPATAPAIVNAITDLFAAEGAAPIGRTIGFISAKGGAGGSTVAHNVAWAISQHLRQDVLILDMDLAFGTAGLNFNQDPPHGIADARRRQREDGPDHARPPDEQGGQPHQPADRAGHARPHLSISTSATSSRSSS